ncbi:MAG: GIY-YIG nuclease family protein [Balneolia bacterium]|nr:GIY-YIG nuclease family protein [Balneolia bacterium]
MYFVYAIKSTHKNYIYVGITSDLQRRIDQHNKGYEKSTKPYAPFELIYKEEQPDRKQARIREKYLKSAAGKRFLRSLIQSP